MPDDHPDQPFMHTTAALAHWYLFSRQNLSNHGPEALSLCKRAALMTTGRPSWKLFAARRWALLCIDLNTSPLAAYQQCLNLLSEVVWPGVPIVERYRCISHDVRDVVAQGTAAAFELERMDLALEWPEQGRCFVWNQLLELRSPLQALHESYPDLAGELQQVMFEMESTYMPETDHASARRTQKQLLKVAQAHRELAVKKDQVMARIRTKPGFENLFHPAPGSQLISTVKHGFMIMINVHEWRCDALVIVARTQDVMHVQLNNFSYQKAIDARRSLAANVYARDRGVIYMPCESNMTTEEVLTMLWNDVVQPIIEHLDIKRAANFDDLPRMTWFLTGPLSSLPIHAAGDYRNPDTVLYNLAVSSYIPNLGALDRSTSTIEPFSGVLLVGQESSIRGFKPLPGTKAELDQVQRHFSNGLLCTRLDGEAACVHTVLQAMTQHSWVHIACHASQNLSYPLSSAFHLHDQDLDLATISRTPLPKAQLAFLSACETAMGDAALPNEVIHLAAGLLMAGFSTVVATTWSIGDTDAPVIAEKFYEYMLEDGTPDWRKASKALHRAVAYLRGTIGVSEFHRWVQFIHIGQ